MNRPIQIPVRTGSRKLGILNESIDRFGIVRMIDCCLFAPLSFSLHRKCRATSCKADPCGSLLSRRSWASTSLPASAHGPALLFAQFSRSCPVSLVTRRKLEWCDAFFVPHFVSLSRKLERRVRASRRWLASSSKTAKENDITVEKRGNVGSLVEVASGVTERVRDIVLRCDASRSRCRIKYTYKHVERERRKTS